MSRNVILKSIERKSYEEHMYHAANVEVVNDLNVFSLSDGHLDQSDLLYYLLTIEEREQLQSDIDCYFKDNNMESEPYSESDVEDLLKRLTCRAGHWWELSNTGVQYQLYLADEKILRRHRSFNSRTECADWIVYALEMQTRHPEHGMHLSPEQP